MLTFGFYNIFLNFIAHDYLGFNRHFGRRGPIHGVKDVDGYSISSEGKHPRKSSNSAYGSNEVPEFDFCIVTLHILFCFIK
jgi:regulator of nonsense transcripts 3